MKNTTADDHSATGSWQARQNRFTRRWLAMHSLWNRCAQGKYVHKEPGASSPKQAGQLGNSRVTFLVLPRTRWSGGSRWLPGAVRCISGPGRSSPAFPAAVPPRVLGGVRGTFLEVLAQGFPLLFLCLHLLLEGRVVLFQLQDLFFQLTNRSLSLLVESLQLSKPGLQH